MHQAIEATGIHPPFARYSHAVAMRNGMCLVSGQLGIDGDGHVPEDAFGQAELCFGNVAAILRAAGLDRRHVARINAFVTGREWLADYMRARDAWIADLEIPPASTLVVVSGLARPEFKVEVEVTASA